MITYNIFLGNLPVSSAHKCICLALSLSVYLFACLYFYLSASPWTHAK